ncbi:MAG: hypothetical protein Q9222_000909 [Ikaeria aurantiellina]
MTLGSTEVNRPFEYLTKPVEGHARHELDSLDPFIIGWRRSFAYYRGFRTMLHGMVATKGAPLSESSEVTAVELTEYQDQPAMERYVSWSGPPLDRVSDTSVEEWHRTSSCAPSILSAAHGERAQRFIEFTKEDEDEDENRSRTLYQDPEHISDRRLSPCLESPSGSIDSSETICADNDEDSVMPRTDLSITNPIILDGSLIEDGSVTGDRYIIENRDRS